MQLVDLHWILNIIFILLIGMGDSKPLFSTTKCSQIVQVMKMRIWQDIYKAILVSFPNTCENFHGMRFRSQNRFLF